MKLTFLTYNEYVDPQVTQILKQLSIDYYTRWEQVKGKGHDTEPHTGFGRHASTNVVLMIGIQDESVLPSLLSAIRAANTTARRSDEHIRLFQVPMEQMV